MSEATISDRMEYGDYTYTVADGRATIVRVSRQAGGTLEIPAVIGGCPVTGIGALALSSCGALTRVTLPDSVTWIGDWAFSRCGRLLVVDFGVGIERIGAYAFDGCVILSSISLPPGLSEIGDSAFKECLSLEEVSIPAGVRVVGKSAFATCRRLKSVTIAEGVSRIGAWAFRECAGLVAITIPDSVSHIGECAFYRCRRLKRVTLPTGLAAIEDMTFYFCFDLSDVRIPDSVTSLGCSSFFLCRSLLNIRIPAAVQEIGEAAFGECRTLEAADVEEGNHSYCSLGGVLYDKGMTRIVLCPSGVVGECRVPAGVVGLEEGLFKDCVGLNAIHVDPENPGFCSLDGVVYDKAQRVLLVCPPGKRGRITVPAGVKSVKALFKGCAGVTEFAVDAANPAYRCEDGMLCEKNGARVKLVRCPTGRVGAVSIPAGITDIEPGAFDGCAGITELLVEPAHTEFGSFDGILYDRGLTTMMRCPEGKAGGISIPASAVKFGDKAFSGCDRVKGISVDGDNPVYGAYDGVLYTKDLSQLVWCPPGKEGACRLPASVSSLGDNEWRFWGRDGVTAFEVGAMNSRYASHDGVLLDKDKTMIIWCPGGKTGVFRIPESVTAIDGYAFAGCEKLEALVAPFGWAFDCILDCCIFGGEIRFEVDACVSGPVDVDPPLQ